MRIHGVSDTMQVKNIYYYNNSHYNQMNDSAVAPVPRVQSLFSVDDEEEKLRTAVLYEQDSSGKVIDDSEAVKREQENLSSAYGGQVMVQYDMDNPYDLARMSMESSILAGMHLDMLA